MITDTITPEGERIFDVLEKLNRLVIKVGILASDFKEIKLSPGESSEFITLGEVAIFQEWGTSKIPPRSFMRSTFDENIDDWVDRSDQWLSEVLSGTMNIDAFAKNIGQMMVSGIKDKIATLTEPELSPVTIEIRRKLGILSTKPLMVTRQLFNNIKFEYSYAV